MGIFCRVTANAEQNPQPVETMNILGRMEMRTAADKRVAARQRTLSDID
jgi:hypothetical protein